MKSKKKLGGITRKNKTIKNNTKYFVINKYKKKIGDIYINIFTIPLKNKLNCRRITLKKNTDHIKKIIYNFTDELLDIEKVSEIKVYNNKVNFKNIFKNKKYTYCLNKEYLLIAETIHNNNKSILTDLLSKHIILCNDDACVAGEMVIFENKLIFDNASGTFQPTAKKLKILTKVLPFNDVKIIDINNKNHSTYFDI
jgi:hypothetical protein